FHAVIEFEVNEEDVDARWLRNGLEINFRVEERFKYIILRRLHRLTITETITSDAGEYTFVAGRNRSVVTLQVNCEYFQLMTSRKSPCIWKLLTMFCCFTEPIVERHLQTISGKEGHTCVLTCQFSVPNLKTQWFKNGKLIEPDGRYSIEVAGKIQKLSIKDLKPEDQGRFSCRYENLETSADLLVEGLYTEQKKKTIQKILQKIKFTKTIQDIVVNENQTATFECEVSFDGAIVSWYKDNFELQESGRFEYVSDGRKRILVIQDLHIDDSGEYNCRLPTSRTSGTMKVNGKVLPHLLCPLEVLEGDKAEFVCSVSKEAFEVKWFKGSEELEIGDKYNIISDGKRRVLVVKNCKPGDEGTFTSVSLYFFVYFTEEDLRIIEPLEDIETQEKKTVSFTCKVNRPNVTLKWMKGGQEIVFDKRVMYKADKVKHTLIVRDCGLADEGEYTVIAGQDKSTAELIITEAPTDFTAHLQDQTVTEFEDAVFTCQLSKEKASVKWYKNGREIREGPR
uniref:Ig-like domain-containing protein n=1 Tax=Erpetoichthys calabaricus TaxID=27687 RepID=A0A8C4X7U4_ERPCA